MLRRSRSIFSIALILSGQLLWAEWLSIDGNPAKWDDIIEVKLSDLHPTQPSLGFDRIYYKLGRYQTDRRKVFNEYCQTNGQKGIGDFSYGSDLKDPKSFACLEPVGFDRTVMKTVVIAPDDKLYLTDGHHTFNTFWEMPQGGPDLHVFLIVSRDYRQLKSMDEFWKQMKAEKNIWLYDVHDHEITPADIPKAMGIANFVNDPYRSLLYFTRNIAWKSPGKINVPDAKFFNDNYPDIPFVEFYWMREVRKTVDLSKYDLKTRSDYVAAIEAVGRTIIGLHTKNVGGSGMTSEEMGQLDFFNSKELFRINRPGTGKLSYMLEFKASDLARELAGKPAPIGPISIQKNPDAKTPGT